jgi:DNA-binding MarR family transcriptional regulator
MPGEPPERPSSAVLGWADVVSDLTRARILADAVRHDGTSARDVFARIGATPAAAAEHLDTLVATGLLVVAPGARGRGRTYRVAGPETAALLSDLAAHAPPPGPIAGRRCGEHAGGPLGALLAHVLDSRGLIARFTGGYRVTRQGAQEMAELGVSAEELRRAGATTAAFCVDADGSGHVGGVLGARLLAAWRERGWIAVAERPDPLADGRYSDEVAATPGDEPLVLTGEGRARLMR